MKDRDIVCLPTGRIIRVDDIATLSPLEAGGGFSYFLKSVPGKELSVEIAGQGRDYHAQLRWALAMLMGTSILDLSASQTQEQLECTLAKNASKEEL
jgi:hypothetical protein